MTQEQVARLRSLEGRSVSVALKDGTRIDDCQLVSAGRTRRSLWLFTHAGDDFVGVDDVIDVWEAPASPHSRAA